MRGLPTVIIGCLIVLSVVGVILKLVLDDIGKPDTCPYCSASLATESEDLSPLSQGRWEKLVASGQRREWADGATLDCTR
jgi:hypothetical protein